MGKKKGKKALMRMLSTDEILNSIKETDEDYREAKDLDEEDIESEETIKTNKAWEEFYGSSLLSPTEPSGRISNPVPGYDPVYPPNKAKKRVINKPLMYCPTCGLEIRNEDQSVCPSCGHIFVTAETVNDPKVAIKKGSARSVGGKTFVVDTNVIIATYGQVLTGLDDNEVVITHTTMEELDKFKDEKSERGYATREAIRFLKRLKEENGGNIHDGIPVNDGGIIRMETNGLDASFLPYGWSLDNPDNRIICAAKSLKLENINTFLITNDSIMAFKAEGVSGGASVQSYHNDIVINDTEKPYTGRQEAKIRYNDIESLFRKGSIPWKREDAVENEYYILRSGSSSALARYTSGNMVRLHDRDTEITYVKPKNAGQTFALDALLTPPDEIPLVILMGAAGCGKTLLAMAAGLDKTYADRKSRVYERIIISRSNTIPEKEDMGFLPGDLKDKMDPLLAPFYSSMRKLLRHGEFEDARQIDMQMDELLDRYVQIQPLAYIRGITVDDSFLIVDEAQNLTIAQVKTLITRMGTNGKLVLCGDPAQIDTPKLSKNNNGLVYAASKFKGSPLCAQITFDPDHECIRSPLSAYAVEVL